MDLVAGGSLAHVLGDYGPLPPRFVCVLLDQLLSGLAAVHAEGVVHRDVKPADILREATGTGRPHLRLSDFGISVRKGEPRLTDTDRVVGTPGCFARNNRRAPSPTSPPSTWSPCTSCAGAGPTRAPRWNSSGRTAPRKPPRASPRPCGA